MRHALAIGLETPAAAQLEQGLLESRTVCLVRKLEDYPERDILDKIVVSTASQIAFIGFGNPHRALEAAAVLLERNPGLLLVAVGARMDESSLVQAMRAGFCEHLRLPIDSLEVGAAVRHLTELLQKLPRAGERESRLFSFLPAKPGSGASTIALNTGAFLSRMEGTRVALMDCDLNSGVLGVLLRLDHEHSIIDALPHAGSMEDDRWRRLVASVSPTLDVLASDNSAAGFRVALEDIRSLVAFALGRYDVVCADLSGNMEKYSLEIMDNSKLILLVCGPDRPSLYLADHKLRLLHSLGFGDRVRVVVNRVADRLDSVRSAVQQELDEKVFHMFTSDEHSVRDAIRLGRPVDNGSIVGQQFEELAWKLLERKQTPTQTPRRFVEYFRLTPRSELSSSANPH